jgi:hypothetical protein
VQKKDGAIMTENKIGANLWERRRPEPETLETDDLKKQIADLVASMQGATDAKLRAEKEALQAKIAELEAQRATPAQPTQQAPQETAPAAKEKPRSLWDSDGRTMPPGRGIRR